MRTPVETRVIECLAPGYEGAFTQYTVFEDGVVWIQQVATRDNSARVMQTGTPLRNQRGTVAEAKAYVEALLSNRTEGGMYRELAS